MNKAETSDRPEPEIVLGLHSLHSLHRLPSCTCTAGITLRLHVERSQAAGSLPAAPEPEPPYPSASPLTWQLEYMDVLARQVCLESVLTGLRCFV